MHSPAPDSGWETFQGDTNDSFIRLHHLNRRQILQLAALVGGAGSPGSLRGTRRGTGGRCSHRQSHRLGVKVTPAKEITWWSNHPGTSKDIESEIIKRFTAESGIKVNLVTAGANYDEVAQKFQAASGLQATCRTWSSPATSGGSAT